MLGFGIAHGAVADEDFLAQGFQGAEQQLGAAVVGVSRFAVEVVVVDDGCHERLRCRVEKVAAPVIVGFGALA